MSKCYVGFDCGTMGTKVAIYADDSRLIAEAYRPHEISYPKPGWAEMQPDQFYRVVSEGLQECVRTGKVDPKDVRGISCSGIVCGFLPIDDDWRPVGPYIPYLDGRAKEEAAQVAAMGTAPGPTRAATRTSGPTCRRCSASGSSRTTRASARGRASW